LTSALQVSNTWPVARLCTLWYHGSFCSSSKLSPFHHPTLESHHCPDLANAVTAIPTWVHPARFTLSVLLFFACSSATFPSRITFISVSTIVIPSGNACWAISQVAGIVSQKWSLCGKPSHQQPLSASTSLNFDPHDCQACSLNPSHLGQHLTPMESLN
jgi:hypothetical protein